ncbi:MAG: hypothetical protein LBT94_00880 [Prevotellaceae bacterium]|nr:hypothetical protein [Prevotellaceae bacterium]
MHSCKAATAQTEHYLGGVAGKVTGPIYTLQHKRWNVTASGGWLTGFKGGYASVLGGYRVVSLLENFGYGDVKLLYGSGIGVDLGLGVFGLGYVAPTLRQRQLARELDYTTPFGVHFTGKVYFNVSPNCSYGMHIGIPLLMNPTEESIGYGDNSSRSVALWKGLLYIYQFSLQYKFSLG